MFVITLIAAISSAEATTYGRVLPMADMLEKSEQVVQGTVAELSADFGDDGLIWTVVTLDVDDTLDRSSAAQVSFRLPGGTVGDLSLTVPGAPVFEPGQAFAPRPCQSCAARASWPHAFSAPVTLASRVH